MAKIAKPKKRETSVHSRSFRRNATPPLEIGKGKKSAADEGESWVYNAQNAGVHKKTKGKKGSTRQQHMRHVKALEKADRNSAVLENKVQKSKLKSKVIQSRAKDWDELNEELVTKSSEEKETVHLEQYQTVNAQEGQTASMDGVEDAAPLHHDTPDEVEGSNVEQVQPEHDQQTSDANSRLNTSITEETDLIT